MGLGTPAADTQTPNAFVRGANLDTSMMYMGSIMSFLVRAQDTDGRFAMVEHRAWPGSEPPPHVHLREHEIFYVLEGKIEFHCVQRSDRRLYYFRSRRGNHTTRKRIIR
jgi:quercetin dioxygenase-like cupin family protein